LGNHFPQTQVVQIDPLHSPIFQLIQNPGELEPHRARHHRRDGGGQAVGDASRKGEQLQAGGEEHTHPGGDRDKGNQHPGAPQLGDRAGGTVDFPLVHQGFESGGEGDAGEDSSRQTGEQ